MSTGAEPTRIGASIPTVFAVAVRRMLRTRRTLLLVAISLIPALITCMSVAASRVAEGADIPTAADLMAIQSEFFLRVLLPLAGILYGGAVIADEVDAGTFVYLWARPVRRLNLIAGRTLAAGVSIGVIAAFGVAAMGGASLLAGVRWALIAKLPLAILVVLLAAPVYAALFGAFGTWFRRPMMMGLIWALVWENMVGMLPGAIRYLTVTQHTRSLFPYFKEDTGWFAALFVPTPAWLAVGILVAATCAIVAAHTLWLRQFELRLKGGED